MPVPKAIAFPNRNFFVWLWVIALLSATLYYGLNRLAVQMVAQQSATTAHAEVELPLNGNATLRSPDDEYYITPPENWLAGRGWRRSPAVGRGSYMRRTPGYSIWYLVHRLAVGPERVYPALLITQIIVFAFSAVAFAATLLVLLHSKWTVRACVALFVLSPWFLSYSFYTITEALSVPLLVFALYWLTRAYASDNLRSKALCYAGAAACWSFATLTRPMCGLAVFTLGIIMLYDYLAVRSVNNKPLGWNTLIRHMMVAAIVPVLAFGTWTVRNYLVSGEVIVLEKYSHPESIDGYKPAFNAAWNLYVAAGVKQVDFYKGFPEMAASVLANGKMNPELEQISMSFIPADKIAAVGGEDTLRAALQAYEKLLIDKYHPYFVNPVRPMPSTYSEQEMAVVAQFNHLERQLYQRQPQMRIISPVLVLKEIVANSNTSNLALFSSGVRDNYLIVNIFRVLLLVIYPLLYLLLVAGWAQAFFRRVTVWQVALMLPPTLLMVFLCFIVGTTEQRYMLPFVVFLVISAGITCEQLFFAKCSSLRNSTGIG